MTNNSTLKTPPHDVDAEKSILCCILTDNNVSNALVDTMTAEYFVIDRHMHIYNAIAELRRSHNAIDIITVGDQLRRTNHWEVDMDEYLLALVDFMPSAANYASYYEILHKKFLLRRYILVCQEGIEESYSSNTPLELINKTTQRLYEITSESRTGSLEHIKKAVNQCIERINNLHADKLMFRGLPTGFPQLDAVTNGLQKGDLIILAARPSVGKTSFALNIAGNLVTSKSEIDRKRVVAIFSIEMPSIQLAQRMISSIEKLDMYTLTSGAYNNDEAKKIWAASFSLNNSEIYVDDSSTQTPGGIFSKSQKLRSTLGQLDLVIIDYLQLMNVDKEKRGRGDFNKVQEVAEISRMLKIMAKDLACPVIVLSQMSRSIETRDAADKQPKLSDLRDSGAIEQDADIVMFLSRNKESDKSLGEYEVTLSIAKHRNGELKDIKYKWKGKFVRFDEISFGNGETVEVIPEETTT
ncbi:MAG: replicative DNA helicase [Christensenellaceae bacterium]|jgi:replicative DNA helicase|nr:replicative DNA helicase [Christensenellaceae bacterium]